MVDKHVFDKGLNTVLIGKKEKKKGPGKRSGKTDQLPPEKNQRDPPAVEDISFLEFCRTSLEIMINQVKLDQAYLQCQL